jgi:hypothetical protein
MCDQEIFNISRNYKLPRIKNDCLVLPDNVSALSNVCYYLKYIYKFNGDQAVNPHDEVLSRYGLVISKLCFDASLKSVWCPEGGKNYRAAN